MSDEVESFIINGILKHEFGLLKNFKDIHILRAALANAIYIYNNQRLHTSLGYLTPDEVHANANENKKTSLTNKTVNII